MQYINKFLKYGVTTSFLAAALLITGCSSKKGSVSSSDINKIYKNTSNSKIRDVISSIASLDLYNLRKKNRI